MKITGIFVYPIKSTGAIAVQRAQVRRRGLGGDRRWVVVDKQGQFLHQRIQPRLAVVRTVPQPDGALHVEAPGMPRLRLSGPNHERRVPVTVWRDTIDAAGAPADADAWFSRFMQMTCGLAFMDSVSSRPVSAEYGHAAAQVSFADTMPLLLTSEASLADLNRRLSPSLPMSRFRPNVVVDGLDPWAEDHWKRLRLGEVEFVGTHRCARCVATTIDQQTGEKTGDGEPMKTLATFRRDADGVYFGQNLLPCSTGTIRVGDAVTLDPER